MIGNVFRSQLAVWRLTPKMVGALTEFQPQHWYGQSEPTRSASRCKAALEKRGLLERRLILDNYGSPAALWRLTEIGAKARAAIAAATGTAKTAKPVECEASQSGAESASPDDLQPPSSTLDMD